MTNAMNLGVILNEQWADTIKQDKGFFIRRGCFMDNRGEVEIAANVIWGYGVRVLTASHDISEGKVGDTVLKKVIIKERAWIGSFALLYNCIIGEDAIVAAGAVVKSCEVAPGTMVEGNPAQVVARLVDGKWQYVDKHRWLILR